MSDPMTNVDIEDVLSSIRRLVAQDADGSGDSAPQSAKVERFVLTPSLRVDRDTDGSDDRPFVLHDALKPSNDDVKRLPDRDNAPEPPTGLSSTLLSTIAELEAAVSDQADDWEDDGTGTDLNQNWSSAGFRSYVDAEDAVEVRKAADDARVPNDSRRWPPTLSEAARLYGGEEGGDSSVEADETPTILFRHHRDRPDDTDVATDDHNDDLISSTTDDLDPEAEAALHLYLDGGSSVSQLELRDMVRDIVREELQGDLGERITRNVRKLVRREIQRVLSNAEMD